MYIIIKATKATARHIRKIIRWGWHHKRISLIGFSVYVALVVAWYFVLYDLIDQYVYCFGHEKYNIKELLLYDLVLFYAIPIPCLIFLFWLDEKYTEYYYSLRDEHRSRYSLQDDVDEIRDFEQLYKNDEVEDEKFLDAEYETESYSIFSEQTQEYESQSEDQKEMLQRIEMQEKECEERHRQLVKEKKILDKHENKAAQYTNLAYEARKKRHHDFNIARKRAIRQIGKLLERADKKALLGHSFLLTSEVYETTFEDFSFVYGNQTFAVRLSFEEVYQRQGLRLQRFLDFDSDSDTGYHRTAFVNRCKRHGLVPCLFLLTPLKLMPSDGRGWNLRNAETEESISPSRLIVPQLLPMSDWELYTQMSLYVMEYLRLENPNIRFRREHGFLGEEFMWIRKKQKWEWVLLQRVAKLSEITPKICQSIRHRYPQLREKSGYLAQFTYSRKTESGRLKKVEQPYRGIAYEIGFAGLQKVS